MSLLIRLSVSFQTSPSDESPIQAAGQMPLMSDHIRPRDRSTLPGDTWSVPWSNATDPLCLSLSSHRSCLPGRPSLRGSAWASILPETLLLAPERAPLQGLLLSLQPHEDLPALLSQLGCTSHPHTRTTPDTYTSDGKNRRRIHRAFCPQDTV